MIYDLYGNENNNNDNEFDSMRVLPSEFLLRVKDHRHKRGARHMLSTPPHLSSNLKIGHKKLFLAHLYPVVTRFGRFILAEDGAVLLALPLHLHPERPLRPPDPHSQLASARTSCVANKPTLVPGESKSFDCDYSTGKSVPSKHTMLDTRSVDANLSGVRSPRHSKLERRARHMVASVLKKCQINVRSV